MYEKTLIWWVPFCAGGLGDRLLGMISAYCISKDIGRDFLIKWDQNELSDVIPINPKYDYYKHRVPYTEIIKNNIESMNYFNTENIEESWASHPHVLIWSNLNLYQYYCNRHPEILYQERFLEAISEIFTEFWITNQEVLANIPIGIEDAIGIHVRTHDNQFETKNTVNRKKQIPYIKDILSPCRNHIQTNSTTKKIFIASACILTHVLARTIFGREYEIVTGNGTIIHSRKEQELINKERIIRVVVDLLSLSKCNSLYLGWNTNFSRFGALINPKRQFYTYEHPKHPNEIYDCGLTTWMNYHSQGGRW